jgi:hypothetical protein
MVMKMGKEPRSLDTIVESELALLTSEPIRKVLRGQKAYPRTYLLRSFYVEFLTEWMTFRNRRQLLFVNSEEFFEAPARTMDKAIGLLGLLNCLLHEYAWFKEPGKRSTSRVKERLSKREC